MTADGQQQLLRGMALSLLTPRRSALVTSVPTPGLAEAHDEALAQYLADMKAGMNDAEIEAMVAETQAFNAWNDEETHNNDFMIDPEDLPDPALPAWTTEDVDGVRVYKGDTALEGVGAYSVFFDLSGMSREELEYLMLTSNYVMQMGTSEHTAAELYQRFGEYVSDLNSSLYYPVEAAGDAHRPMLCVSWASLTEDFDKSLDLVLELYTQTDYSDLDMLNYLTATNVDAWDMSRKAPDGIAMRYAHDTVGLMADTNRFEMDVDGQDCYVLYADAAARMADEEGYAEAFVAQLENAQKKAFTRGNLVFMSVANAAENDAIADAAVARLNRLPEKVGADAEYRLPEANKSLAVCVESSMNTSYLVGDYMADADFTGKDLPFWYALSDLYTVPTFRFRLGAYTAYNYLQWGQGCLSVRVYSDPNVRATVEGLAAMPEALQSMTLTQEGLNGYILSAYSDATAPQGMLNEVMVLMQYDLFGADRERTLEIKKQIKAATLDDQAEAVERINAVMADADYCMAGNENLIRADADCFDEVVSWRQGMAQ